jgi:hypothetical protein
VVDGLHAAAHSGLIVNGNAIGTPGGNGIWMRFTRGVICSNNSINQVGSGAGHTGLSIAGTAENVVDGVVCTGNVITGRYTGGGSSAMIHGLSFNYCTRVNASNNLIADPARDAIEVINARGEHIFSGTTGFPRSGPGSPDGAQTSYYTGEMYFDTMNQRWWAASKASTAAWAQVSP